MDSLKLTKGSGGSKPSTSSIPLAIRFNAEEESIEEFIKPSTNNESTTLLNSPQQNLEDFSWKTIQGNLFSRNRSGSIEGISTAVNLLPSSDTNTIGTWKLIKGKVSQAMEDIKSSKSVQISNKNENIVNDQDSDQETSIINISVNDDIPPSSDNLNSPILSTIPKVKLGLSSLPVDSDSDVDIESTVDDTQTISSLSFRKSLANLRSKSYIKTKARTSKHKQTTPSPTSQSAAQIPYLQQQQQQKQNPYKKDESPSRFSSSFPSTKSESFLKMKRKYDKTKRGSSTSNESKPKKDNEIESGIEVCEDMILPSGISSLDDVSLQQQSKKKYRDSFKNDSPVDVSNSSNVLGISITDETITFRHRLRTSTQDIFDDKNQIVNNEKKINDSDKLSSINYNLFNTKQQIQNQQQQKQLSFIEKFNIAWANITKKFYAISTVVLLISILILPLPGFFCGVFTCLFTISLISCIIDYLKIIINKTKNDFGIKSIDFHNFSSSSLSFDGKFKIPNNLQLQVCEIPAAEEHLSLKSYSGWMNEINNYDPANHHLSMTTPVFVKLSGSMLILSNTTARIPKRAMWNETIIDKDNITFTRTRCFNLLGCRVEMCPKGLARKRHFSRKYPIQLIIKNLNPTVEKSHVRSSKTNDLLLLEQQQLQQQQQVSDMKIEQKETNRSNSTGEDGLSNLKSITNTNNIDLTEMKRHSLNESGEDLSDKSCNTDRHSSGGGFDFGSIVSNSDLQKLQSNCDVGSKEGVPCGDETRLLLFARCDREKEDWYRRFNAASRGLTFDQQEHIPDIVMFTEDEIAVAVKATSNLNESEEALTNATTEIKTKPSKTDDIVGTNTNIEKQQETRKLSTEDNFYEGVLITSCALRNPTDFIRFMAKYQKACFQSSNCPASTTNKVSTITTDNNAKRNRRQKSKEDDLWKGIDQAVFKQQSGNVVWFNILIGRILYNCLNNKELLDRIQEFLQRKLSAIRLPSFMEDVIIDELDLGDTPPLIHRVSQPLLDERGTWVDADISYEGLMHMTITTKLNLLRLKRQQHHEYDSSSTATTTNSTLDATAFNQSISANNNNGVSNSPPKINSNTSVPFINSAIYDSNAESTGASSSESESQTLGTIDPTAESHSTFYTTPGSSRRFLRIVDRITASNLFQSATEISYIQRAMENMSTKITLKVELKGLVSRVVVNIPPPPSDRVWLAFRGPPRLWISAKPTVGEHAFDWSIVTTIIENKLCDEVYKYLVYPNMVDIIVPILGESTYKEDN